MDANEELLENDEEGIDKEAVEKIAQQTHMRTIYPMLHSSYKLNTDYAEEHLEAAERAWEVQCSPLA